MCRDLRIWVICAGFAFAALITLVIGRKMLREQFEHCRTEKRLEAREIVGDEEAMAEYKLKGGRDWHRFAWRHAHLWFTPHSAFL